MFDCGAALRLEMFNRGFYSNSSSNFPLIDRPYSDSMCRPMIANRKRKGLSNTSSMIAFSANPASEDSLTSFQNATLFSPQSSPSQ